MIWVWLAVLAAAVIVELVTPTALVSIWFAAGALAAVIFTILHAPFWLQIDHHCPVGDRQSGGLFLERCVL